MPRNATAPVKVEVFKPKQHLTPSLVKISYQECFAEKNTGSLFRTTFLIRT